LGNHPDLVSTTNQAKLDFEDLLKDPWH
jgi:hypothetical protein